MPPRNKKSSQLRLRVFAGPNGSGKSTILNSVRAANPNGRQIDMGDYINADDITASLRSRGFSFSKFRLQLDINRLNAFAESSGLINEKYTLQQFKNSYSIKKNSIVAKDGSVADRVGQIIARFLREEMLKLKRKFTFETVFSHDSNLEIMKRAAEQGYKVYLYYVCTDSPTINKFRVELRVRQNGHDVDPDKIEKRYYESLGLLPEAVQCSYQTFFFDNSQIAPKLFAHSKRQGEELIWDYPENNWLPAWFQKHFTVNESKE